jgi:hypothetical protein
MKISEYKKQLEGLLEDLSSNMHNRDIKKVRKNITRASSHSELDAISLGLNFHKFRVEARKKE